jgi:5-methylcytosine-specific restriction endonuclease McrA
MALFSKCNRCRKEIPYRTWVCEACRQEIEKRKNQYGDEKVRRFRSGSKWQQRSKEVLKEYHYQCQLCKHEGKVEVAEEVHHIIPLSENFDLRLEWDNLIPLCKACHYDVHHNGKHIPPYIE